MLRTLALVTTGALVLLAGSSRARAQEYVGADVCKTCHEAQYQQWRTTGHAVALARLSAVQQRDRVCRSCHTMDSSKTTVGLVGVQCESCHGPGGLYQQRYVMKDKVLARLLGLTDLNPEICTRCHAEDGPNATPFNFEEAVKRVAHPNPAAPAAQREGPSAPTAQSEAPPAPVAHAEAGGAGRP